VLDRSRWEKALPGDLTVLWPLGLAGHDVAMKVAANAVQLLRGYGYVSDVVEVA